MLFASVRIDLPDKYGLDDGQQFCRRRGRDAQRCGQSQRGVQIPADHRARQHPQLPAKTPDQIPDLPALEGQRLVCAARAVRAALRTGRAVAVAPTEGPLGEGAETFFSCSSSRPLET